MDNLVRDLDAELQFVYCRFAALLEQMPHARMKRNNYRPNKFIIESTSILDVLNKGPIDQYLKDARGNSHRKALLCAAYASTKRDETIAAEFMQVIDRTCAYSTIEKKKKMKRDLPLSL
jgi:hypothetical protein